METMALKTLITRFLELRETDSSLRTHEEDHDRRVRECSLPDTGGAIVTRHAVYAAIVAAVRYGRLVEPFGQAEFQRACPGFADGTYRTFLHKHCRGNPSHATELFERVSPGRFRLIRPFRYGL